MSKDLRLLVLCLALFIGQFIVILAIYARYSDVVKKLERNTIEELTTEPYNYELDSLKQRARTLERSVDSLQIVKARIKVNYKEKIEYVYQIKDKSASLDSLTTYILLQLDSAERAGYFKPVTH